MTPVYTLLVEDDPADKVLIEHALSRAKRLEFAIEWVRDRPDAEQILSVRTFDLILLDLTLPSSHGIDTVYAIVRKAPNTPIVVLSGREDLDVAVVSVRAGAQAYLRKNLLTPEHVELEIFSALERSRNEKNAKKLYVQSIGKLASGDGPRPLPIDVSIVEPHLRAMEECLAAEQVYLQNNSPHHWEAIQHIRQASCVSLALREIRSILDLDPQSAQQPVRRRVSDIALMAVHNAAELHDTPQSDTEAHAALLGAFEGFTDDDDAE